MAKKKRSKKSKKRDVRLRSYLEDVEMAHSLIDYARKKFQPESLELAALILQDSVNQILALRDRKLLEAMKAAELSERRLERDAKPAFEQRPPLKSHGLRPRGAAPSGIIQIQKGQTVTLNPNRLFEKNTRAVVSISSQSPKKLFVYWRREGMSSDPSDFKVGKGDFQATWLTGMNTERWVVEIENRSGPNNLAVKVNSNAIG